MLFEYSTGEYTDLEFGKVVRGIRHMNERPLNCYISPIELEKHAYYIHQLAAYLRSIQNALKISGRIIIK